MALYEHIYLVRQDVAPQQVEALSTQLKEVVEGLGGTVPKVEYWGLKPLAYRIRKNRRAHFALLNVNAAPSAIAEMERQLRLNEDVLRFMTVRVDVLEEGPSVMMRKREETDREERPERRSSASGHTKAEKSPRRSKGETSSESEPAEPSI